MKRLIYTILGLALTAAPMFGQSVRRLDFASDVQTIPVMGNTPGAFGSTFQTYVALLNPDAQSMTTLLAQFQGRIPSPLPLNESILQAWPQIVSLKRAFHGRTMGALAATPGLAADPAFAPMLEGFRAVSREEPDALRAAGGPLRTVERFEDL